MASTTTKRQEKSKVEELLSKPYKLILHNDDYNTFEWVIQCLCSICGHTAEQASQCAHIVHFKGKCDVKYGDYDTISDMKSKLENAKLSVTMDPND